MERRTAAGWIHYLEAPDAQLTLSEFMALCLRHSRENGLATRLALEHVEGMVGALDDLFSRIDPSYARDGEVRAALDARRDQARVAALDAAGGG